jgi:hypothetical protein
MIRDDGVTSMNLHGGVNNNVPLAEATTNLNVLRKMDPISDSCMTLEARRDP